jgi:integrin alpha 8
MNDKDIAIPSQVIYAESVYGMEKMSTFGFSVSGGIDLDNNLYPDMVVGAYNSERVVMFR